MAQSYRAECPPSQVHCVLIADDLTGACDAAAPFRAQGASVRVLLNFDCNRALDCDVLSLSTDSRDLSGAEIKSRLAYAAANLRHFTPGIVFKKIDSTLRGKPGEEIAAAIDVFDCEIAVIAPAFPEMGRHVRAGYLHSDRDRAWRPIHVETLLRTQGIHNYEHIVAGGLRAAFTRESRFISLDTEVNEDLETIVTETLRCGRRVLWAGSAGLAGALARALFPGSAQHPAFARQSAPVLFAIGSDHIVTAQQLYELSDRFAVLHVDADSAVPETLAAALRSGRHTILKIGRNTTSPARLADLLAGSHRFLCALLVSGGDTASLVCRALDARAITLEGEIVTGLPWGKLEGDLFGTCLAH